LGGVVAGMSADVAVTAPAQLDLHGAMQFAQALAQSNLLPAQYRGRPANVLWAIEFGKTLNLTPMASMLGVHVIDGKPSASAGLISGLVRRAGHRLRVKGDATRATCQIVRSDDPDYVFETEWTIARAEAAGLLGKDVWKRYPAAMLKARAITECARDACEEVLFGLHYTPEELGAQVDAEGEVIATEVVRPAVQVIEPTRPPEPQGEPLQVAQAPFDATLATAREAAELADPKAIRGLYTSQHKLARDVDVSKAVTAEERALVEPYEPKIGVSGPVALKWWLWGCMQFAQANRISVAEAVSTGHVSEPAAVMDVEDLVDAIDPGDDEDDEDA
jgi:hypothetical protein